MAHPGERPRPVVEAAGIAVEGRRRLRTRHALPGPDASVSALLPTMLSGDTVHVKRRHRPRLLSRPPIAGHNSAGCFRIFRYASFRCGRRQFGRRPYSISPRWRRDQACRSQGAVSERGRYGSRAMAAGTIWSRLDLPVGAIVGRPRPCWSSRTPRRFSILASPRGSTRSEISSSKGLPRERPILPDGQKSFAALRSAERFLHPGRRLWPRRPDRA